MLELFVLLRWIHRSCVDHAAPLVHLSLSPKGKHSWIRLEHPFAVMAELDALLKKLQGFMDSDTIKNDQHVIGMQMPFSIMEARNVFKKACKYQAAVQVSICVSMVDNVMQVGQELKSVCPLWSSWASDAKYDERELPK